MGLDTLARVKTRLSITGTTYDVFLQEQIDLISDTIEAYCRRKFEEQDWIQTFYGDEREAARKFFLFHYPVSDIEEISQDGFVIDDEAYRFHKETGLVNGGRSTVFFHGDETIVKYTAGYPAGEIPTPIISVLDSLVQERYNKKISGINLNFGSDVQRVSIPGVMSIDFDYSLSNNDRKSAFGAILGNNLNILDYYRSERAVVGSERVENVEEAP